MFIVTGEFFKLQKIDSREFVQVKVSAMLIFNRSYVGATNSEDLGSLPCPMRPRNTQD